VKKRLRHADAITDAKINFFIQGSWELPKYRSILKQSLAECKTALLDGHAPGGWANHASSVSYAVFDGL
jgi:hypothetical protein